MSVAEYQAALPKLFEGTEDNKKSQANNDEDQGKKKANAASPAVAPSSKKGFVDIIEYHTEGLHGPDVRILPTDRFVPQKKKSTKKVLKYDEYAVVLRRTWRQQQGMSYLIRLELEIQSEVLCKRFQKAAVNLYENTDLQSLPLKIRSPFSELFFYRKQIEKWSNDDNDDPNLRRDAKVLYDFIQNNGLISSIVADHEKYSPLGQVVSDIIWTIYPPNSLVVVNMGKLRECWICRNVSMKQTREATFWVVTGLRIGFDGASPGLVRQEYAFPALGLQVSKISELPIVPIEHCEDWATLKTVLMKRSAKLQRILGDKLESFAPQQYEGIAYDRSFEQYHSGLNIGVVGKQIDERVIVDYVSYQGQSNDLADLEDFKHKPKQRRDIRSARGVVFQREDGDTSGRRRRRRRHREYSSDDSDNEPDEETAELQSKTDIQITAFQPFGHDAGQTDKATDGDLEETNTLADEISETFNIQKEAVNLLYPALVPGFGLKRKKWQWFLSDELQDVKWNPMAFESLQLEKSTKHLVEALVKGHKTDSAAFDDVMPGKGQGLIFLLHGKPGLGKTLTAESVADFLERPLYSISGGEMSTDVRQVESRLDTIFDLTKRWDAVVLLDEADVLLCKRNSAEMDRNAIVGVFLRKIEYFQGVLFLTTNRKQDFDEAFKSRIHVTISFPELSSPVQSAIWEKLIAANRDRNVTIDDTWNSDVFEALGGLGFNGRTIKNILRTAVAYANADTQALGARHVLAIVQTELKGDDDFDVGTEAGRRKRDQIEASLRKLEGIVREQEQK